MSWFTSTSELKSELHTLRAENEYYKGESSRLKTSILSLEKQLARSEKISVDLGKNVLELEARVSHLHECLENIIKGSKQLLECKESLETALIIMDHMDVAIREPSEEPTVPTRTSL